MKLYIGLCKVIFSFNSGIHDHLNESSWAAFFCGAVYDAVQGDSTLWARGWNPKVWPSKWSLSCLCLFVDLLYNLFGMLNCFFFSNLRAFRSEWLYQIQVGPYFIPSQPLMFQYMSHLLSMEPWMPSSVDFSGINMHKRLTTHSENTAATQGLAINCGCIEHYVVRFQQDIDVNCQKWSARE